MDRKSHNSRKRSYHVSCGPATSTPRLTARSLEMSPSSVSAVVEPHDAPGTSVSETILSLTIEDLAQDSDDDTQTSQLKPGPISTGGKYWMWFGPKSKFSIYYQVLTESDNLKDVAFRWANLFQANEAVAMSFMIQFVVDITGYPKYSVEGRTNEEIIDYMVQNPSDSIQDHDYLFKTNTIWCREAQAAIFEFIDELIKVADYRDIIYNTDMIIDFTNFFKSMSLTKQQAIVHSGVVFALKFAIGCANVMKKVEVSLKSAEDMFLIATDNFPKITKLIQNFAKKRDVLNKYLKSLYDIVLKNYYYEDDYLENMRIMCARDIYMLLRAVPNLFFNELRCIPILLKLLIDQNHKVRMSVVQTFKMLLKTEKCSVYVKGAVVKQILKLLSTTTIYDIKLEVAAAAINAITLIMQTYPNIVSNAIKAPILRMVYHKSYTLGGPAGNFLATCTRHLRAEPSHAFLIERLVRFHHATGKFDLTAILVESVIDSMPELQMYDAIVTVLTEEPLEFKFQVILLDILRHTISQIVTGTCKDVRINSRRGTKSDQVEIHNIRHKLIPKLVVLFTRYKEKECQEILMSILLVCMSTEILLPMHREEVNRLFKVLRNQYLAYNKDITDMLIRMYKQMSEDLSPLQTQAMTEVEYYIFKVVKEGEDLVKARTENELSEDEISSLEVTYMRLSILHRHYDLSTRGFVWSHASISNLLGTFHFVHENIYVSHIECGEYHVLWELRRLIEETRAITQEDLSDLKLNCANYLDNCFSYLEKCKSKSVKAQAFWSICNLIQEFYTELKELRKTGDVWKELHFMFDEDKQELLINFLLENVLKLSVSDDFGCKYLGKFFNAVMLPKRQFPLKILYPVFTFYYVLRDKYQQYFEVELDALAEKKDALLEAFILAVLVYSYKKFEDRENFTCDDSLDLKRLAVYFSLYLTKCNRLFYVVDIGLKYAVLENLSFLRYLHYFTNSLEDTDRVIILEKIKKDLPQNNEHVVFFENRLKMKPAPQKYLRRPQRSDTSTTRSTTSLSSVSISESVTD